MLTTKFITENSTEVIARLAKKHFEASAIVSEVIALDTLRKTTQTKIDKD